MSWTRLNSSRRYSVLYSCHSSGVNTSQLGCVTLDNASNNDTAMREFEDLVNSNPTSTIPFDADGNRIRYAINDPDGHARVLQLVNDLTDDICSKVRSIIGACRASGQRRNDLTNTIKQGREDGSWSDMPILQLLRDIDIRWSSTYNSHDRLLILYSAIHFWLGRPSQASLVHHQLTQSQLQLLTDIQDILRPAHAAQELLSAEKTPTLSLALPAFELMLEAWMALQKVHMDLSHYIGVGMEKVIKYVTKGRKSRVYALAMIINPTIKLEWIKQHWPAADAKQAEEWMIDAVRLHSVCQIV
ncbi:ribonuclease H-like domain-containing protein [Mycena amicta]|nr:ribonuclease H-like domain-containing protein [Mycena amicta]